MEACPTFLRDNNVSAQPSTAISWVAASSTQMKKRHVMARMLAVSSCKDERFSQRILFSAQVEACLWTTTVDRATTYVLTKVRLLTFLEWWHYVHMHHS